MHIGRMNRLIKWSIRYCLLMMLLASCSRDEYSDTSNTDDYDGLTVDFRATSELTISTRTELTGAESVQHVQDVYLYVFNGGGVCVASEDVNWKGYFQNLYGEVPVGTANMTYRVKYKNFIAGKSYTLLAVGCDAESGHTYGFPSAIAEGTLLADARATLQTADYTDIHQSELLSGKSVLTYAGNGTRAQISLYRRVAGIIGWFTNLPSTVGGVAVESVRVSLYKKQNKSVPLLPLSLKPVFLDYTDDAVSQDGGEVLVEIPVTEDITPDKIFCKGSFVLPVDAPPVVGEDDYTLRVELVGDGKVLWYRRVKLGDGDELDPSTSSGTGIIDTEGSYRFPIIANQFYGIGSLASPIDIGGKEPVIMLKQNG